MQCCFVYWVYLGLVSSFIPISCSFLHFLFLPSLLSTFFPFFSFLLSAMLFRKLGDFLWGLVSSFSLPPALFLSALFLLFSFFLHFLSSSYLPFSFFLLSLQYCFFPPYSLLSLFLLFSSFLLSSF